MVKGRGGDERIFVKFLLSRRPRTRSINHKKSPLLSAERGEEKTPDSDRDLIASAIGMAWHVVSAINLGHESLLHFTQPIASFVLLISLSHAGLDD
jgi:hypothetical protein